MSPLRRTRADEPDLAGKLSPTYPQEAPDPYESAADPSRRAASARARREVVETRDVGDYGEQEPSAFRRVLTALGEARRRVLPLPDEVIDQYLGSGERVIYNDHPSFRSFVVSNTLHFAGFLVLAVIFLGTTFSGSLIAAGFILLVLSVLLLVLVLKRLSNRYTSYVITDTRILRISGIISRSAHSIPWVRVTDLTIEESFLGRLFGYATLRIESANEESGLKDLEGVSNPLLFNQYVIDMVVAKQGPTEPRWAQTGEPAPMPTNDAYDELIVNHGYDQENLLFRENNLGLNLENDFFVKAAPTGLTNVPGIFAAGDCIRYTGKVNLIAGAYADAVNAVNNAKTYIDPKADQFAMVSSHNQRLKNKNKKLMY